MPMMTLDSVVGRQSIDLMKIDIEGAEYLLARSSATSVLRRTRYVIAEIHEAHGDPREVVQFFADHGLDSLQNAKVCGGVHCFVNRSMRSAGGEAGQRGDSR